MESGIAVAAIGLVITTSGSLMGLGWWLSGQFRRIEIGREKLKDELHKHLSDVRDGIDTQITYHERLDDERFTEIKDRLSTQDLAMMRIELRGQRQEKHSGPYEV